MTASRNLRVAVLVDLPRSPQSGGHVKCWERLAAAAAQTTLPLDLTVYFSGTAQDEVLGPLSRLCHLPPVFSTARLKFLPYVPDHTDLAPHHFTLARELAEYDVIHTTDGFFAFARTAERVSRRHNIPLVTSLHTDTPSYTRIFTRQTIERLFVNWPWLRGKLIEDWKVPERQQMRMQQKLENHMQKCRFALVTRADDHAMADALIGQDRVRHLRLGVDKNMFNPHRANRHDTEIHYNIPPGRIVVLFVGRVDVGKNIYTLIDAMAQLIKEGVPLHLIAAGQGPAIDDVRKKLHGHASLPGFVAPDELARLYASVDMLALCSEVEIRSMAGVEAMASGCPVLVSSKSGVHDLFHHTHAMLPVDSGVENWVAAFRTFLNEPERPQAMRKAALEYSLNHLARWQDVLADDLLAVWQQAAGLAQQNQQAA